MTIGIYCIEHIESGKKYVGKSVRIENRLSWHKYHLTKDAPSRSTNRHLWNAVHKHGWDAFKTYILQKFDAVDEDLISLAELEWIDKLKTCDRAFGFNLRRDSSTKMIPHPETLIALSDAQKRRYSDPDFGDYERQLMGERSRAIWSQMSSEKKRSIGESISERMRRYDYLQCDMEGNVICVWESTRQIKDHYPDIHIPNVHSVADGHKATYLGFIWEKVPRGTGDPSKAYNGTAPEVVMGQRSSPPQLWVLMVDPSEGVIETFTSVAEAAKSMGVSYGYMSNCIHGRVKSIGGYEFKAAEPPYISLQKHRKQTKHLMHIQDDLG